MSRIAYKEGYKFQLVDVYSIKTSILGVAAKAEYATIHLDGTLVIHKGYAWDGASGPAIDTPNFIRGSLVHDVLYQMIWEGLIPIYYRKDADDVLIKICKEDGMSAPRRWWVKLAVNTFGARALEYYNPVLYAPEK